MYATDTPLGIALRNIRIHSASFECIKWFSILPNTYNSGTNVRKMKFNNPNIDLANMSSYANLVKSVNLFSRY